MDDHERTQDARDEGLIFAELDDVGLSEAFEIGRGGFGIVYRCNQKSLERIVAVKVLRAGLNHENQVRFFREQRAMGRLTGHPNIVNVLHVDTTVSGFQYIVMPYFIRGSIDSYIRSSGPLCTGEALRLGVRISGALESAHALGILHRDVKPANILITDYGEPVLSDFGIAHIIGGYETESGIVTGSIAYSAPEILNGMNPSVASDIYSLGATLSRILTGYRKISVSDGVESTARMESTFGDDSVRNENIPKDLQVVIEKAMSANPHTRPSMMDFGEMLREIQKDKGFQVDEMALSPSLHGFPNSGRIFDISEKMASPPSQESPLICNSTGALPCELTSFVGRRKELSIAKNLLSTARLLTLTGVGGVGKTRLAVRLADGVQKKFSDGVKLIEFGQIRIDSMVVEVVAGTLGLRSHSAISLSDLLVGFLRSREMLLVFDNCEQVIDTVAKLSDSLLRQCPKLRIIVTSRESMGIAGEAVIYVSALSAPDLTKKPTLRGLSKFDAVTLFVERAILAVPSFQVTEVNIQAVSEICSKLEGLPLSIELAAARLKTMSSEQILQRLTDRYALLTKGRRGAPTRQQSLRWSIDWSYELCSSSERGLWGRLSVLVDSFELDAAVDIGADSSSSYETLDLLTGLVEKSILTREEVGGAVRFRLFETLREYGLETIRKSGIYEDLRRKHLAWFKDLAFRAEAAWISSAQLEWISTIARNQANLREALEYSLVGNSDQDIEDGLRMAISLFPFWLSGGHISEGRKWLARFLSLAVDVAPAWRMKAIYNSSVLADLQGDIAASSLLVNEGLDLAKETADVDLLAYSSLAYGNHLIFCGDFTLACVRLVDSTVGLNPENNITALVEALLSLGWANGLLGETDTSLDWYEKVISITESCGETVYRSYAQWGKGVSLWRKGDLVLAREALEQGLQLTRTSGDILTAADCLESLSWILAAEMNGKRSATLSGAASALRNDTGTATAIFPDLIDDHNISVGVNRSALGERAFESAYRKGRSLDFLDAISFGLGGDGERKHARCSGSSELTKREAEVASLVAEGLTNKSIAERLFISNRTVQGHVEHILTKLEFRSRSQISAWFGRVSSVD